MSFLETIGGIFSGLEGMRSSVQAGKANYEETGNLMSAVGAGFEELFTGEYQEQKELQSTIDAEQRALDNARALRDEENAYNSPQAQAERLKQAGINPMSVLANSSPVAASSTTLSSSGGQRSKTAPPSMSNLLAIAQAQADIDLKEAQAANLRAGTGKLTVETALAEWDVKLKEQLYNYNSDNYPILLKAGQQKLTNSIQEYNNLVAKENYDKVAADELRQRILVEQQEVLLLAAQKLAVDKGIEVDNAKLSQMAQDLETGKFKQKFAEWQAKNEEWLAKTQEWKAKITKKEFQDLWATGYMRDKTKAEKEHYEELVLQLQNENSLHSDIWDTGKTGDDILPQLFRRLLYLATEII